jgi:hypothetical protein
MTFATRKFWLVAIGLCLTVPSLAIVSPAIAQTDLNRFVPKFGSGTSQEYEADEDVPPGVPSYQQRGGQRAERNRRPQPNYRQQNRNNESRDVPASYQSSASRYQNPRYQDDAESDGPELNERSYSQRTSGPRMAMNDHDSDAPTNRRGSPYGNQSARGMYENSPMSRQPSMSNSRPRNSEMYRGEMPSDDIPADHDERYADVPASYQPSGNGYPSSRGGMSGYGRMNNYGGMNGYGNQSGGMGLGRMGLGNMNFGGMFGGLASRTGMSGGSPTPASPYVLPEPVVTKDAVYIDAEPVKAGKPIGSTIMMPSNTMSSNPGGGVFTGPMSMEGGSMPEGREWLQGGPIMGRSYDGFTNPQCNDCCGGSCSGNCGGNCGGGCCGGQRCGDNHGMYGGCEEGYDCCGGCGPNYGLFNGPYGRPWILAPLDFVFGGLWHCGPYWGACDPCGNWWWGQDFTVFGGVHDFRSPVNITGNSNFGFQEGVNWAMPLWHDYGIGAQVGFQATQSNLQNNSIDVYDIYRNQTFITAGLFHRPCDGQGWQYGAVFDYLRDEFYQTFSVGQLRGELSWLWDCQNELGFWFATGVMDSDNANDNVFLGADEYSAINQYAFFYRRRFCRGGEGRLWGGFTGNSGGLVGADFRLPISKGWALESGFNYIINENNQNEIFRDETWNVGMNLVWYWGGNAKCRSLYRPLFNVADNGSFMVNRSGLITN